MQKRDDLAAFELARTVAVANSKIDKYRRKLKAFEEPDYVQRKAHYAVFRAKGVFLHEKPCEVCGATENVHAHHDDYSKPLEVRWLCSRHHAEHHQRVRKMSRR
jgi:ribosomal protein S27AE